MHSVKVRNYLEERCGSAPLSEQPQCLWEPDLVIEFGKTDHVTAAPAPIAIEQVLAGVENETGVVIGMERTQSHESTSAETPGRMPIMSLQVVQQWNLLL
jgi:hypothetical protein